MRVAVAFLLAAWSGGANASSIITLAPMNQPLGPSMIVLGEPAAEVAGADPDVVTPPKIAEEKGSNGRNPDEIRLSPSVIALGEPEVTSEKVAAIGGERQHPRHNATPMVIRGGIAGDAFSPAASTPAPEPQAAGQQTGSGTEAAEQPKTASSDTQTEAPAAPAPPTPPAMQPK